MKKLIFTISVLAILTSCKEGSDLLDPETSGLTETDVFTNAQYTDQFLTDIYGDLLPVVPQTGNKGMRWRGQDALLEVATDNGSSNLSPSASFRYFNSGSWSPTSNTFSTDDWELCWSAIRSCNLFLSHIDDVPLDSEYQFDETTRDIRKGEALFLLAFNYAELAKQFGGLPLIDKPVSITDEDMNLPRSTFDETIAFITGLCDQAAGYLPDVQPEADYGRATKGAALALKARMLLYAASPLWNNPDKPEDSPFRGAYDQGKWGKAAEAAADVMDLNLYQLHDDISTLFITRTNSELIFAHMNQPCSYMTSISVPNKLYPPGTFGKSGCNQVTFNMIREYEVVNEGDAYFIDDPASGYDPNDPYKKRDPRFYRDCMFNGYPFQGKTTEFGVAEPGAPDPQHNPSESSPYNTYVYSVKFADLDLTITWDARAPSRGPGVHQNYPYLRYAEVLLNYAEAMNEAFGPEIDGLGNGKTALWAVNEVRTRAKYPAKPEYMGLEGGMPPIEAGLSKDVMREKIRHERRVEFSFEEHRFWDVRRWKIDPSTMTEIQAQIPVWKSGGSVEYEIRTIETRVFEPKMYRMPIP